MSVISGKGASCSGYWSECTRTVCPVKKMMLSCGKRKHYRAQFSGTVSPSTSPRHPLTLPPPPPTTMKNIGHPVYLPSRWSNICWNDIGSEPKRGGNIHFRTSRLATQVTFDLDCKSAGDKFCPGLVAGVIVTGAG